MRLCWLFVLTIVSTQLFAASDTIYLDETVITGNQELPKVLYILPWRDMETELLPERTLEFSSQSVLVPIYPEEQNRELGFRRALAEARRLAAEENSITPSLTED